VLRPEILEIVEGCAESVPEVLVELDRFAATLVLDVGAGVGTTPILGTDVCPALRV